MFITTPIWAVFLMMSIIPFLITLAIVMYSKIGGYIINWCRNIIKWVLYDSKKPRRWVWNRYYDFVSWLYPKDAFYIMNSGYALLSDDGLLKKFTPLNHESKEIYQYQLYYIIARMVGKKCIKDKRVVDLSCGRGGGTFFLYSLFKPKKIYGVDSAYYHIKTCRDTYIKEEQKALIRQRNKMLGSRKNTMSSSGPTATVDTRGRTQSVNIQYFQGEQFEVSSELSNTGNRKDDEMSDHASANSLLQKLDEKTELEFIVGEAETLQTVLAPNSIDCLFCIESSHCYGNLDSFFKSVFSVLRTPPEECKDPRTGLFLYADYFDSDKLAQVKDLFLNYFEIVKQENITPNVQHSLDIDGDNRRKLLLWQKYGALLDLNLYDDLQNKKKVYYVFLLKKKLLDPDMEFFISD